MDWLGWIEDGIARFRVLPAQEQWLTGGTGAVVAFFVLLYWSQLGNRRTAIKCLALAIGLHALTWAYADRYDVRRYLQRGATPRAKTVRVPIQMAASGEMTPRQEVASIQRALRSAIEQSRLSVESMPLPETPKPTRRSLDSKLERPAPAEEPKTLAPKFDKMPEIATPQRKLTADAALPAMTAAPAKELRAPAIAKTVATAPTVDVPARRDLDPTLVRRYTPPDAVLAQPSSRPLGPVVERLSPEPIATARSSQNVAADSGLDALEAVAPPSRRVNGNARPPVAAAAKPWSEKDVEREIERLGKGASRDIQLVLNRAETNRRSLLERHGGSARTERAVHEALAWLAAHQDPSGKWGCTSFPDRCPQEDMCDGMAIERTSDVGVTGLALLAFLGAGHTPTTTDLYGDTLRRGLDWLVKQLQDRGHLMGDGNMYSHAMATLALTEALLLTGNRHYRLPAQEAVDYIVKAQHPNSGGWRYGPGQFGDTSVYGWVILSLRSAEQSGLRVPEETWRNARRWLDLVCSGPSNGLASYQPNYPHSAAMTAEALVCRQILGTPRTAKELDEAGIYLLSNLPDPSNYHVYYWYYGTLGMFQLGGGAWQRWNDRLTTTLLATQEKIGHRRGSWEPKKPFGVDGGRVFSTACSALCLEVYYRYLPLYDQSGVPHSK